MEEIKSAIQNLFALQDGTWNFDLAKNYALYFPAFDTNSCNCREMDGCRFKTLREFSAGKVGATKLISDADEILIQKTIKNVSQPTYLPVHCAKIKKKVVASPGYREIISAMSINEVDKRKYLVTVRTDNFTNQTLMNVILPEILRDVDYVSQRSLPKQLNAFYCSCSSKKDYCAGISVMKFSELDSLSSYFKRKARVALAVSNEGFDPSPYRPDADFVRNIIRDIMAPLLVLKSPRYSFVHADMKPGNIFLALSGNQSTEIPVLSPPAQPTELNGTGELVDAHFLQEYYLKIYSNDVKVTAQLADFDKSSVTYNNVRFFHLPSTETEYGGGSLYGLDERKAKAVAVLAGRKAGIIGPIKCHDDYYVLSESQSNTKAIVGSAMYYEFSVPLSYDIYVFMVGLVLIPGIHELFLRDAALQRLWQSLWLDQDIVDAKILAAEKKYQYRMPDLVEIISSLRLKLDLSEFYRLALTPELYDLINEKLSPPLPTKHITLAGKHLCLSACIKNSCVTPKYRARNWLGVRSQYERDSCKQAS